MTYPTANRRCGSPALSKSDKSAADTARRRELTRNRAVLNEMKSVTPKKGQRQ